MVGKSTADPGKFIFFLSPILQLFNTSTITDFSLTSFTLQTKDPSAIKILDPGYTDLHNLS